MHQEFLKWTKNFWVDSECLKTSIHSVAKKQNTKWASLMLRMVKAFNFQSSVETLNSFSQITREKQRIDVSHKFLKRLTSFFECSKWNNAQQPTFKSIFLASVLSSLLFSVFRFMNVIFKRTDVITAFCYISFSL